MASGRSSTGRCLHFLPCHDLGNQYGNKLFSMVRGRLSDGILAPSCLVLPLLKSCIIASPRRASLQVFAAIFFGKWTKPCMTLYKITPRNYGVPCFESQECSPYINACLPRMMRSSGASAACFSSASPLESFLLAGPVYASGV